jgi:hypothetical protein
MASAQLEDVQLQTEGLALSDLRRISLDVTRTMGEQGLLPPDDPKSPAIGRACQGTAKAWRALRDPSCRRSGS